MPQSTVFFFGIQVSSRDWGVSCFALSRGQVDDADDTLELFAPEVTHGHPKIWRGSHDGWTLKNGSLLKGPNDEQSREINQYLAVVSHVFYCSDLENWMEMEWWSQLTSMFCRGSTTNETIKNNDVPLPSQNLSYRIVKTIPVGNHLNLEVMLG